MICYYLFKIQMNKQQSLQNNQIILSSQDPYKLIRKLKTIINEHLQTIEQYKIACDSYQSQKQLIMKEVFQLKKNLERIRQKNQTQQLIKKDCTSQLKQNNFKNLIRSQKVNQSKVVQSLMGSPIRNISQMKSDFMKSIERKSKQSMKSSDQKKKVKEQFIPSDVKFISKRARQHAENQSTIMNETVMDTIGCTYGQNLVQNFMVIGPNLTQLKKLKEQHKNKSEFKLEPYLFYNFSKTYKHKKSQFLLQITKRAFSQGLNTKKKLIQNFEQYIRQRQYLPEQKMCQDYFVFTLQCDEQINKNKKVFMGNCNINKYLYVVCLKIPDFVCFKDEKHYQREQTEVWEVEKCYILLSYYPFMKIHMSLLSKIQKILFESYVKKSIVKCQEYNSNRHLLKNIKQIQRNQKISNTLNYFMNKKIDFNQYCTFQEHYFGSIPTFGFNSQYSLAKFACPIFFSTFSYEEMILLITALLTQITIIFMSKDQSLATLCGLFLISIINPLPYCHPMILNCDEQKIDTMVFSCPITLLASIKKTNQNYNDLLTSFVNSKFGYGSSNGTSMMIFVDIDSNSILYDEALEKIFEDILYEPPKKIQMAYHQVNDCNSKSFSFPKKMLKTTNRNPKNQYQRNQEDRKKLHQFYKTKIETNKTKNPTYTYKQQHEQLLKCLIQYIKSFTVQKDFIYELAQYNKEQREKIIKNNLLQKHKQKGKLIDVLLNTQIYAQYLYQLFDEQ